MKSRAKIAYDELPYPTVIVVGGGFAGLEVVRGLAGQPYKVVLLDRQNHHCFQPLLYQVATASLSADSIAHPFRRTIGPMHNVAYRMADVQRVDPERKVVETNIGDLSYDYLILALGSTTNFFGNRQMERTAMQLKSISQALDIRSDVLQDLEAAISASTRDERLRALNFVIVGAGPTGVELAGALAEIRRTVVAREYREMESDMMQIVLIDSNDRVLKNFSEKSSTNAQHYLEDLGVDVRLGDRVVGGDDERIQLSDGGMLETNTVIWAAGVKGAIIPGLEADHNEQASRYEVDRTNALKHHPEIFVLGDCALMTDVEEWPRGHPQVATVAIQQGQLLVKNFVAKASGRPMESFTYRDKGSMAVIGRRKAVVDIGKYSFGGTFAWLLWMFVHVIQLVSFRNRMMVLFNWGWKYLSWKNTIRLIIRPYIRRNTLVSRPFAAQE
ncbi:MAG: NAD(P)/FAD-dependent oxidoreductase [Flavobacteriales bacterium]|jgi:NADH dehydrogenase|nr:NAD(P)/FAD-dependent oxidoreductase [Flavobacteriales bacterium]MBK7103515.1 NAD(P)/FAD-dependent oxidoreductase [Flavobacteriales bacterium]MBK7112425.1 NAD(P)/FAD-dependent oxidoreductase [Flavobacteriales bacterium]MBK7481572.1 NAD(P)/FAD-dependent oxidoreductase [Flavobacteriales bacterium]MBK7620329.1 NAD(P)/FAD-dependent oxidoreductase [Flavobacteriales bacterium]